MECLQLMFIYSKSKFKVTLNTGTLELRFEEKQSKISNNTLDILPVSHQNTLDTLIYQSRPCRKSTMLW